MRPHGCANSSKQTDPSTGSWTPEASPTYNPMTSSNTFNATSSPESADGALPSNSPVGPATDPSGPSCPCQPFSSCEVGWYRRRAPPSAYTFSIALSRSAAQLSLASRLRANLDVNGSPEYERLEGVGYAVVADSSARASARRRISGSASSGWPTPNTLSGGKSMDPSKMSSTGMTLDGRKHGELSTSRFAGWPTPDDTNGETDRARTLGTALVYKQWPVGRPRRPATTRGIP